MAIYKIHPIVLGTKVFDKGMVALKARADILIPLHEPRFAAVETVTG